MRWGNTAVAVKAIAAGALLAQAEVQVTIAAKVTPGHAGGHERIGRRPQPEQSRLARAAAQVAEHLGGLAIIANG